MPIVPAGAGALSTKGGTGSARGGRASEIVAHRLENARDRPQPGEAARFLKQEQSPTHKIEPQLLALLPGKSKGTNVLLLGGVSAALGAYLTSPAGVEALDSAWATNGRPAYFEAIILAETEGTALVRARLAAYHPRVVSH